VFSPLSRPYSSVSEDQTHQDFVAIPRRPGPALYLGIAGRGLSWVAYHVVPSLQLFWAADQLLRPEPFIPLDYVWRAALYAGVWCAAMVEGWLHRCHSARGLRPLPW